MNRQQIINMVADFEIDRKIASTIFNFELNEKQTRFKMKNGNSSWFEEIFEYSSTMDNAMLIVELLRKNGIYLKIEMNKNNYEVCSYHYECSKYLDVLKGESLPLLICKIALLCNMYEFVTLEV